MLTPSFNIIQDEQFVIVNIRVPYVKISEAEFHINGCEFKFFCKPYFLRLHLPGQVTEDGREKAVFDIEKGSVTVHLPKLQSGEHFDNLGMLTTLLSKKPAKATQSQKPLIEVIGANVRDSCSSESEDDIDWQAEQILSEDHPLNHTPSLMPNAIAYGFANQHSGVFLKLQEEIPSIIDCPDPDHMTSYERRLARIAQEEISFSPDHYLADLMDNDVMDSLLKFEPAWKNELTRWKEMKDQVSQNTSASVKPSKPTEAGQEIVPFSQSEREKLKDLPNKDYLLDKASSRCLYLGLIDIIFAFAYNHRTTEGEGNVESAWTVCKLSPTLSWLEVHRGSVHDVVCNCLRRSLCYPLYRHWQLTLTVLQDTRDIFRLGRRKLLQSLLSVHHALNSSEPYYVLNNLYITDYCVWVQTASVRQIQSLADDLDEHPGEQTQNIQTDIQTD
ncbi:protein SHQ1 homolog isoform X2 [Halichondria panicea]|uniref:protein SHQ1 homolog isoform X2 n=1 Tax=Halichondria panicea TaxID=6063 RepID=UPI00312B4AB5